MLSILVPIYNFNVVKLVQALKKQCDKLGIDYEILCFDDMSDQKYKDVNRVLSDYFRVNYTELSKNLGRAKIRNWLIKSASYKYLLFLDCDSKVVSKEFIKNYIEQKDKGDVISGGRVYSKKPPKAFSKKLHWLYGVKKESKDAKFRSKHSVSYFHSNNFLAKNDTFKNIKFDEKIEGYGYEDLLLAQQIIDQGFTIKHIQNPVEHLGLEKAKVFIEKSEKAIDNLLRLKYSGKQLDTNLVRLASRLQDFGLKNDFIEYASKRHEKIRNRLLSKTPKIRDLDIFKLLFYYKKRQEWIDGFSNSE